MELGLCPNLLYEHWVYNSKIKFFDEKGDVINQSLSCEVLPPQAFDV